MDGRVTPVPADTQPLTLLEVISSAASAWKRQWRGLLWLTLLLLLPYEILDYFVSLMLGRDPRRMINVLLISAQTFSIILPLIAWIGMMHLVEATEEEERLSLPMLVERILMRLGKGMAIIALLMFIFLMLWGAINMLARVLAVTLHGTELTGPQPVLFVFGLLVLLAGGYAFGMSPQLVVLRRMSIGRAMERSLALANRYRLRTAIATILLFVFAVGGLLASLFTNLSIHDIMMDYMHQRLEFFSMSQAILYGIPEVLFGVLSQLYLLALVALATVVALNIFRMAPDLEAGGSGTDDAESANEAVTVSASSGGTDPLHTSQS
ncbi:hypothetical protein KQI65_02235 [bacterium]|nr:hypothetical protein [bacterium]